MSQPTRSNSANECIPITTKYLYVTAMSVPRETLILKDTCSICNGSLGHPCVKCTSTLDDCPVVVGACRHAFHQHCFEQWVQAHGTCPFCREKWQEERVIRTG
ncbi:Anaphase-promoting complex subunit 11 RING-H2 finger protein [Lotmaria passim]